MHREATVSDAQCTEATLATLAQAKPGPPGLHSVTVTSPITTTTATTLLSQALLRHSSSITSLTLTAPPSPQEQPALLDDTLSTIARLTHLRHLAIAFAVPLHPESHTAAATIAALAATITALPALADFRLLDIHTLAPEATAEQQTRKRKLGKVTPSLDACTAVEPPTLDPVIAALATRPALTSLTLSRSERDGATPPRCCGIRGAFPALQELHIGAHACTALRAAPLWLPSHTSTPLPVSPLPTLTALSFHCAGDPLDEAELREVVCSTLHAPRLRALTLSVPGLPSEALEALRAAATSALCEIEAFSLCMHAVGSPEEARGVGAAVAPLTALTRLHVCVKSFAGGGADGEQGGEPGAADMLRPLRSLLRLRNLSLSLFENNAAPAGVDAIAAAPLSTLTALTALSLVFGFAGVPAEIAATQVSPLRGLCALALEGVHVEDVAEVRACIAPLTALTSLVLGVSAVDYPLVRGIGEWAGSAEQVQHVRVQGPACDFDASDPENGADDGSDAEREEQRWFRGLLYLPARGRYEFDVEAHVMPSVAVGLVKNKLEVRGAVVTDQFRTIEF